MEKKVLNLLQKNYPVTRSFNFFIGSGSVTFAFNASSQLYTRITRSAQLSRKYFAF
ncbi:unnamed protein product [Schistosoma mattheei]|uniref:Uncharacterized protein n=1 Tax=Schistosoma mattheei TaxID=31246 RepID=A0A183PJR9_9TREM|nr:unnamed protein product [Schistosoma mattheei]